MKKIIMILGIFSILLLAGCSDLNNKIDRKDFCNLEGYQNAEWVTPSSSNYDIFCWTWDGKDKVSVSRVYQEIERYKWNYYSNNGNDDCDCD